MPIGVVYHGGHCCGIKHLHGFQQKPTDKLPILKRYVYKYHPDGTIAGENHYFQSGAPAQTALERFDLFVKDWKNRITNGILEVALADNATYNNIGYQQSMHWREIVEKAGFKEVTNCYNSNSGNRVTVFHLTKDKKAKERIALPGSYKT